MMCRRSRSVCTGFVRSALSGRCGWVRVGVRGGVCWCGRVEMWGCRGVEVSWCAKCGVRGVGV